MSREINLRWIFHPGISDHAQSQRTRSGNDNHVFISYLRPVYGVLGTAIGFNQQSLIKRHILRNPGYHRGFRISHIFRHSAVVGILETENGMRLAHPVSAALAEPAFSAGDDLVCCNPVSQGEAFHLRTILTMRPTNSWPGIKGGFTQGASFSSPQNMAAPCWHFKSPAQMPQLLF